MAALAAVLLGACGAQAEVNGAGSSVAPSAAAASEPALLRMAYGNEVMFIPNPAQQPSMSGVVMVEHRIGGPFGSPLSPLVIPYDDGMLYLAVTSQRGEPTTSELRYSNDGSDVLVAESASSVAVAADGRIAVTRSTSEADRADIVVLDGLGVAKSTVWSPKAENFVVLGWADSTLLAIRSYGDSGQPPDLVALGGPDTEPVELAAASVTAISPDGNLGLLDRVDDRGMNTSVLVDTTTLKTVGAVDFSYAKGAEVVLGAASWHSNGVVASAWVDGVASVALLEQVDTGLRMVDVLVLPGSSSNGLNEPYLSSDGTTISGWVTDSAARPDASGSFRDSPYLLVSCSLDRRECASDGIPSDGNEASINSQLARVRNPSGGNGEYVSDLSNEQR